MTVHLPKSMYEREYVDIVESRGLHLPRLYDSVEVVRLRGFAAQRTLVAPFLGFGIDTLARGGTMKVMAGSEVKSIPLTTIVTVTDRRGGEWEGKALLEQLGQLPLDRALLLKSQTGDTLLAVNDVDSLFAPRDPGWRWVGLGVGAVVDVAALVVLSVAMSDFDIDLSGLGRSR